MSVLFAWLGNLLTQLFGKTFIRAAFKMSIFASFLTMFYAAVYAYMSAAKLIITNLNQAIPDVVTGVWGWVMPSNVSACLLALVSATMLRFFTNQYRALLNTKLRLATTL